MNIFILYKKRATEAVKDIDSIHETEHGVMLITALKGVKVVAKADIESFSVSF